MSGESCPQSETSADDAYLDEIGDGCWYEEDYEQQKVEAERYEEQLRQRAIAEADFDYFNVRNYRPDKPKQTIGEYVAEAGFNVPLIENKAEWIKAFDADLAMIRSELWQDYDGYSGLLFSERLRVSEMVGKGQEPPAWMPLNPSPKDSYFLGLDRSVPEGLRKGYLEPAEYMSRYRQQYNWLVALQEIAQQSAACGGPYDVIGFLERPQASRWRYIEGTNVTVFADPSVEGRYHFGVIPFHDGERGWIEPYMADDGEYDLPQHSYAVDSYDFVARPYIEAYEAIRCLPLFDSTQAPVMELQAGEDGKLHFLQYLKTGLRYDYAEPFDLPTGSEVLRLTNVRGATPPEGREMRLYLAPMRLTEDMRDQAIFLYGPYHTSRWQNLIVPLASVNFASFILHEAYINFKDNHYDSAPICRPLLAAGCNKAWRKMDSGTWQRFEQAMMHDNVLREDGTAYLDIRLISNGREAVIESDWQTRQVTYGELPA